MALRKKQEAINYVSEAAELEDWIRDFADHLKTSPDRNYIQYPKRFADGFAKIFKVSEGLTCRIVDYRLNTDFLFKRKPADEFYLIIYLYNYRNCRHLELKINGRPIIRNEDSDYSSLLMTNSLADQQLRVTEGTLVQGLTIQLTEEWLLSKLNPSSKVSLTLLKEKDILQTLIKPAERKLMDEIFSIKDSSHFPDLSLSARILSLLEHFFNEIFKNGLDANVLPAFTHDVQNLLTVEQYLLENYQQPFPTISTLARMATMSESKLKQVFKKAFGMSLFEYFQRNRMHKARELLISESHSVTEVGQLLGYHNLSNFSVAYKKEFGVLPKDAAKIV